MQNTPDKKPQGDSVTIINTWSQYNMINPPKTLEEHREYLHEIVKLKLFFLHDYLYRHPEENFSSVIRERVDIYRKTDANPGPLVPDQLCFDSPPWSTMEKAAEEIYRENPTDSARFEERAFLVFRPSIDARCLRDFQDRTSLSSYQCGCLRHDLEVRNGALGFHIANSKCPDSFFAYPEYVKACFAQLLDIAENSFNAKNIGTNTWLNSFPPWRAYFPAEWMDHMSVEDTDVRWHYGFWGQFISSRGTFNRKNGEFFRKELRFPFYPRASYCSVTAMRKHLALP